MGLLLYQIMWCGKVWQKAGMLLGGSSADKMPQQPSEPDKVDTSPLGHGEEKNNMVVSLLEDETGRSKVAEQHIQRDNMPTMVNRSLTSRLVDYVKSFFIGNTAGNWLFLIYL